MKRKEVFIDKILERDSDISGKRTSVSNADVVGEI